MSEAKKERSPIIVGNFEVALPTKDGRTIKMSGYVFADDEPKDINARLDMCQDAIERQALRTEVQLQERHLAGSMEALEMHAQFMHDMGEKQKSGRPLATVEKERLKNTDGTVGGLKRTVAQLEASIKAGKAKLNGAHAP